MDAEALLRLSDLYMKRFSEHLNTMVKMHPSWSDPQRFSRMVMRAPAASLDGLSPYIYIGLTPIRDGGREREPTYAEASIVRSLVRDIFEARLTIIERKDEPVMRQLAAARALTVTGDGDA